VLGLGVVTRAISYLANRSLWLDESMIALNIESRSFMELANTLDFGQVAPLGFLWLEKLSVTALGVNELALRLWPYLAGVVCLFLIDMLASRLLRPAGRLFAVSLVAVSGSLIYYSSEVKQYSFDVLLAVLLMLTAVACAPRLLGGEEVHEGSGPDLQRMWRRMWLGLASAGALAVWFSHPLVFVLPGVLLYLWMAPGPRAPRLRPLLLTAVVWGASFAAAFYVTARGASQHPAMAQFWVEGFMPIPPTRVSDIAWFVDAASGWIRNTLDFSETESFLRTIAIWCGFALAVVGAARAWVRDRAALVLIASPVVLALLASALRLYPFKGRLILFLVPSTIILMGWGVDVGVRRLRRRTVSNRSSSNSSASPRRVVRAAFLTTAFIVLLSAASITIAWSRAPYREELRPVLIEMAERVRSGDLVYLHSGAQHAALFYERTCEACGLAPADMVRGGFPLDGEDAVRGELARLPVSQRLWVVFSHEGLGYQDLERDQILTQLESRFGPPDTVTAPGAEAYLFDGTAGLDGTAVSDGVSATSDPDPRWLRLSEFGLRGELALAGPLSRELAREAWEAGRAADAHWLALRPAYLILYGLRDAQRALAVAETVFDDMPFDRATAESGLVLADFFARAGQPDRARAFAESWLNTRLLERPHAEHERVQALLSIATGNPGGAIARLQSDGSRSDGCFACVEFDLAVALEAIGESDSAIVTFERYLETPERPARSIASFARPHAMRRLVRLYESRTREGRSDSRRALDTDRALALNRQLDELWSGGDSEFRARE